MPVRVRRSIVAIWLTIFICAIAAVVARRWGMWTDREFAFLLFFYALLCIFPYKLSNGSNVARYLYLVLSVGSILMFFAGVPAMNKVDYFVSVVLLPIELFILYGLFHRDSSAWFNSR